MKTLEEIKNELAVEKGYISWSDIDWYLEDENCQSQYPLYAQEKYLSRCIQRYAAHVWEEARKEGFMIGAKYGYEYHKNTSFPSKSFDDNVKGNVLQIIESDAIDKIPNIPVSVNPFKK